MYNGTTLDAMPMPVPPRNLATITNDKPGINAHPAAENINNAAESNNRNLRPNRSLNSPEQATPTIQPTNADKTNQPSWAAVNVNCFSMRGNTPDTTAISKPKRKPP